MKYSVGQNGEAYIAREPIFKGLLVVLSLLDTQSGRGFREISSEHR